MYYVLRPRANWCYERREWKWYFTRSLNGLWYHVTGAQVKSRDHEAKLSWGGKPRRKSGGQSPRLPVA